MLEDFISTGFDGPYRYISCQNVSISLYKYLSHIGIKTEIVFGDILRNSEPIYKTKIDDMMNEYRNQIKKGLQNVHCWITLGDDTIIDGVFYDYSIVELDCPIKWHSPTIVTRAQNIYDQNKLEYIPMFIGEGFLLATNTFRFPI